MAAKWHAPGQTMGQKTNPKENQEISWNKWGTYIGINTYIKEQERPK